MWFSFVCRKRNDNLLKDLDKKQDIHRENLAKLQQQFQQAQVKAAARAWWHKHTTPNDSFII